MEHCVSPGTLPEIHRRTSLTGTPVENRRSSLCQSQILPHHLTIEETFQEEPWSIPSNHNPRVTLVHPSPTRSFLLHPPCLPHIPTRTGATRPISAMRPTPATSSRD